MGKQKTASDTEVGNTKKKHSKCRFCSQLIEFLKLADYLILDNLGVS